MSADQTVIESSTEELQFLAENEVQRLAVIDTFQEGVYLFAANSSENGLQVKEVDIRAYTPGLLSSPEAGTRTVTDTVSFLAELDRFKLDDASTLWGDETRGRIVAIYNDHTNESAGHRDNKLELVLRVDEDWANWHQLSDKYMPQSEFGDRVEELLHTVVEPSQAELMEVIDSIRATSKGSFESSIVRATGSSVLEWREDVQTTAGKANKLEVPREIVLALRPFEGLATYKVPAWFRTRVSGGRLELAIKLKPTRPVVRRAWSDLVEGIEEGTTKPVLASKL